MASGTQPTRRLFDSTSSVRPAQRQMDSGMSPPSRLSESTCEAEKGYSEKGYSEKGYLEKGYSEKGYSEKGYSEKEGVLQLVLCRYGGGASERLEASERERERVPRQARPS